MNWNKADVTFCCLDCGHRWDGQVNQHAAMPLCEGGDDDCPKCGSKMLGTSFITREGSDD